MLRGILYSPNDFPTIMIAGDFFNHVLGCENCRNRAETDPEAKASVAALWEQLDALTLEPLDRTDYDGGLRLCQAWMNAHLVLGIDAMEELQPHDDDMIEVVRGESPTQH